MTGSDFSGYAQGFSSLGAMILAGLAWWQSHHNTKITAEVAAKVNEVAVQVNGNTEKMIATVMATAAAANATAAAAHAIVSTREKL